MYNGAGDRGGWRGEGGGGRRTKYWSRSYHLWLTDQPCDFATWVSKKKEKKKEEGSSFCLECCCFCTTQEEVGRSHIQIHRKEEKKNLHQDLCPNGADCCNYKAQISDQAFKVAS